VSDIPDDVMAAAKAAVADEGIRPFVPVARAIMAERARCASLAAQEVAYCRQRRDESQGSVATRWNNRMGGAWRIQSLIEQGATQISDGIRRDEA
jgi:hypothetical protein